MVPPGMGELNYLQSLIASIANQDVNTTSSPTFVGLTLSGLTASVPIVTDANKALASVTYAAFKASLAIDHGTDLAGLADDDHPQYIRHAIGTAIGDLLTASGVGAFTRLADVAAGQPLLSGGVSTVPAYAGYTFSGTAAQTYTFPSTTSTLLATTGSPAALVIASQAAGDLLYASSASTWARLPIGDAGKALVVGVLGTPQWQTIFTNPMDDAGQLVYGGASGTPTKLAAGATTTILVGGGAAAPVWTTATGTGAPVRAGGTPTFTEGVNVGTGTSQILQIGNQTSNSTSATLLFKAKSPGGTNNHLQMLEDYDGYFKISTQNISSLITINTVNGNVGIGETATTHMLQIKKDTDSFVKLERITTADGYAAMAIKNVSSTGGAYDCGLGSKAGSTLATSFFYLSGNNTNIHLAVLYGGNIGIGTTTVRSNITLDVNGGIGCSRLGLFGTYNYTQIQGIWSISPDYLISTASNNAGNAYGMVYNYETYGVGVSGFGHQVCFVDNGIRTVSISLSSGHAYFAGKVGIGSVPTSYSPIRAVLPGPYASNAIAAAAGLSAGQFYRLDNGGMQLVCIVI